MEEGGLDEEIEVLEAIYVDELNIKHNDSSDMTEIMLQLHPATGDDIDQRFVCMTLILNLTPKYPVELPDIIIKNPRGISEEEIASLREDMHTLCEEKRGSPMLYEIIELAKDSLTAGNIPHCPCMICLEHFHEGEKFTKTECYHYFHESCLSRYVSHVMLQTPEVLPSHTMPTEPQSKLVCPVCREQIHVEIDQLCTVSDNDVFTFVPNDEIRRVQNEMSAVLERQKACGGIIDVEAEKNKYLVTNQDIVMLELPQPKVQDGKQQSKDKTSQNRERSPRGKPAKDDKTYRDNDKDGGRRNIRSDKRPRSGYDKDYDRNRKGSSKGYRDPVQYKGRGDKKFDQRSNNGKHLKDTNDKPQKIVFNNNEDGADKDSVRKESEESEEIDETSQITEELESKLHLDELPNDTLNMNSDESKAEENVIEINDNKEDAKQVNAEPNISKGHGFGRREDSWSKDGKFGDKSNSRNRGGFGRTSEKQSRNEKYKDNYDGRNKGGFRSPRDNQSRESQCDKSYTTNRGGFGKPREKQSRNETHDGGNRGGFGSAREKQSRNESSDDKNDGRTRGGFGRPSEKHSRNESSDDKNDGRTRGGFGRPSEKQSRNESSDDKNDGRTRGGFGRPSGKQSRNGTHDDKYDSRNKGGFGSPRDNQSRESQCDKNYIRNRGGFGRPSEKQSRNDTSDSKYDGRTSDKQAGNKYDGPNKGGFGRPRENHSSAGKYNDDGGYRNKAGFGRPQSSSSSRFVNRQDNNDRDTAHIEMEESTKCDSEGLGARSNENQTDTTKVRRGGFGTPQNNDLLEADSRMKARIEGNRDKDNEREINSARGSKHFQESGRKYGPRNHHGRQENFKTATDNHIKENWDDTENDKNETKPEISSISGNTKHFSRSDNSEDIHCDKRNNDGHIANAHTDTTKPQVPPGFKVTPPPGFDRPLDKSKS